MADDVESRSKFLAFVLRHQPQAIGLQLDPEGWVRVDDLVTQAVKAGHVLDAKQVLEAAGAGTKRRYELSSDGQRIRAIQGHSSAQVQRQLVAICPPPQLFHGTATRFMASIQRHGLRAGERHHVHLSADALTARDVGQRHGKPVVYVIDAMRMHDAGHAFYRVENGVWLTGEVLPEYLSIQGHSSGYE